MMGKMLKTEMWKMSPKFSTRHVMDRGAVNRCREHRRELIWGKRKVIMLNWILDKLHWSYQLQDTQLMSHGHFKELVGSSGNNLELIHLYAENM